MKNSPFNTIFLVAVLLSSLWSVLLCYTVIARTRELRELQGRANAFNYRQVGIQALLNDAMEYSKKNPAMDPLLESLGVKQRSSSAVTNKPAAK